MAAHGQQKEKRKCENQAVFQHIADTKYKCRVSTIIGQGLPEFTIMVVFPKDLTYNITNTRIFYNKHKFYNHNKRINDEYWDIDWQKEWLNLKLIIFYSASCEQIRQGSLYQLMRIVLEQKKSENN